MNTVLKVEKLSKQYRLGMVGVNTFKEDTQRWWAKIRGKEDPFLSIGVENNRTLADKNKFVWSLKDINFEIKQGEVLGIIGKNGAGKSTLLKILSKVTAPTIGTVKVKGRIASLLEVGTGFHPELTGRENIYLNGAILGMRKHEITRKLDEIIAFAGVEKYVDTPVKRYSSGMYVRLAFAVAAHLESEILIVDEVLAVGDAEFQKKCLGKMGDVSKNQGRTILFVSHNIAAVRSICNKGMVLDNGLLKIYDGINKCVDFYNSFNITNKVEYKLAENYLVKNNKAILNSVRIYSNTEFFNIEDDIYLEVIFNNFLDGQILNISTSIYDDKDNYIIASPNLERVPLNKGLYKSVCKINKNTLNVGRYFFSVLLIGNNFELVEELEKIVSIETKELGIYRGDYFGQWNGIIRPYFEWKNNNLNNDISSL
jgi:lipopolysaccharide transport system ATP-binding protein